METEQQATEHELIKNVQKQLNEEKWTRTTIENYTKKNFTTIDELIDEAFDEGIEEELYDVCINHITHTQQSIIALYIIGMISLKRDAFDLSALYKVINQFREYKKYGIVEFLAERILEQGDDKFVLDTLKDVYELTDNTEELHKIWERIVKIDYENGEIPRKLAKLKLEQDNEEEAIYYYKTALKRYARKHHIKIITELWETLMEYIPLDLDFFYLIEKEITKHIGGEEEVAELLKANIKYALENDKIEEAIELLIKVLRYTPKDKEMRNQLAECFKIKYKDHSQLNECLKISSLNQTWKNFETALDEFQRRISFDVDNFVYHRSWGIGKITELTETHMIIDFEKKKGHRMSLNMALNSLKVLPPDHIWIKKQNNIDELKDDSPEGIENTLKAILKSLDNEASRKEIKGELVPDILTAKEWTKWWTKAKKVIKKDDLIGQSPAKKDYYTLRDNPLTFEEETIINFRNVPSANFDDKLKILIDFVETKKDEKDNIDVEVLGEMLEYFYEKCNKSEMIDDRVIKSFLLLNKIKKEIPGTSVDIQLNPKVLREMDTEQIENIYIKIENQDFKRLYLKFLKSVREDWAVIFGSFMMHANNTKAHNIIFDELMSSKKYDIVKQIFEEYFTNQRQRLEAYIWSVKTAFGNEKLQEILDFDEESTIINLIRMLDIINKDIENKKKVTFNKKMHSQIVEVLTKEERIEKLIHKMKEEERQEDCQKLLALIRGTISLKEKTKSKILKEIYEAFPELEKEYESKREKIQNVLIVTQGAYEKRQKEYQHLVNVEIPQNSLDIGKAQEKGDLKENAEYQMALEKQKQLQTLATKMDQELRKAKILDYDNVNTTKISIGTKVTLLNLETKKRETYSILGEWDSNIEKNIISYMSPLGKSLIGAKVMDIVIFKHEGNEKRYKVVKIKKANSK